ncbi:MAG: lactococcin 972 family bacteriocin [Candidatus Ancillula trichonymphae]|nr:lactococcin 972 family bacteriocin [Candidatus Ancillula trichonymphae]
MGGGGPYGVQNGQCISRYFHGERRHYAHSGQRQWRFKRTCVCCDANQVADSSIKEYRNL